MSQGVCSICRRQRDVFRSSRHSGQPVCHSCYRRDRYHDASIHEECADCHEVKPIRYRPGGSALCANCYEVRRHRDVSLHERCASCRKLKPVANRSTLKKPLCANCYQKMRPATEGRCSICQAKKTVVRARITGNLVCKTCYGRQYANDVSRHKECADCGRVRRVLYRIVCTTRENRKLTNFLSIFVPYLYKRREKAKWPKTISLFLAGPSRARSCAHTV
jgi:hypothetical protein